MTYYQHPPHTLYPALTYRGAIEADGGRWRLVGVGLWGLELQKKTRVGVGVDLAGCR